MIGLRPIYKMRQIVYNKQVFSQGETCRKEGCICLGYMLVFILLKKIEELQNELNKYKNNQSKN